MALSLIDAYWEDWLELGLRWLHVIAGIVWIGTSFYFVALDNHLGRPRVAEPDVAGESWEIHGGGFYRISKYTVAPEELPEPLHWFKWEAYTTWLSGFGLLVVLYYWNADTYLIDPSVADIPVAAAIAVSLIGLAAAWVVYDLACKAFESDVVLGSDPARDDRGVGVRRRSGLLRARCVPPGRRNARDDHGRQRPLQHHPCALGADPGEGSGPSA